MSAPRLNADQLRAVQCLEGRLIIDAGAGSGKTRVLAERFVNAVRGDLTPGWGPADVEDIVSITFTEKAAGELGERIRRYLRDAGSTEQAGRVDAAWISTIHSLCARILRACALEAGVKVDFTVADDVEAGRLRELAFEAAAEAVLETEEGQALFAAHSYERLYSATTAIAGALRARGRSAEQLVPERVPDVTDILERAIAAFRRAEEELAACVGETKTLAKHRAACRSVLSELEWIHDEGLPAHAAAERVWQALVSWKPGRTSAMVEDIAADLASERNSLLGEASAALTHQMARGMVELVRRYEAFYEQAKAARGVLDFDDLQQRTLALLSSRDDVAARYRERFRMVMVDEFQDTDALQSRLVEVLAGDDLCTVGDERQSIYGFRGADVGVYQEHAVASAKLGAERVVLKTNYRSHPEILGFVDELFGRPELFGDAFTSLRPGRDEPVPPRVPDSEPRVEIILGDRTESAAAGREQVAAEIAARFDELHRSGFGLHEMVVLVRSYRHAGVYADALRRRGLAAIISGGNRFFELREVAIGRALIRAIANPSDDEAVGLLLSSTFGGMSPDGLARLRQASESDRSTLFSALEGFDPPRPQDRAATRRILEAVSEARQRLGREPLSRTILRAVERAGWDLCLLAEGDMGREAFANVVKLARMADDYESNGGAGPAGFSAHLDARDRLGNHQPPAVVADDDSDAVRIMSIHAAKGLEFPVVALPGLDDPVRSDSHAALVDVEHDPPVLAMPVPSSHLEADRQPEVRQTLLSARLRERARLAETEEAKRLLYVACTRAEELLLLGGAPAKSSTAQSMLSWVTDAIGVSQGSDGEQEVVGFGSVRVRVRRAAPGQVDEAPAASDTASAPDCDEVLLHQPAMREEPPSVRVPDRLSYSTISRFLSCPLRFRDEEAHGVRPAARGTNATRFGSAVHAALELAVTGAGVPGDERLGAIARYHDLDETSMQRLRDAVAAAVRTDAYRSAVAAPNARAEVPFAFSVESDVGGFILHGALDLYARDGDRGFVLDYKTGTSGDGESLRERYRLQAECYALAALADGCERVEVTFLRPEVLDEQAGTEQVRFTFEVRDAARIREALADLHEAMSDAVAPRAVKDQVSCEGCRLWDACPAAPPAA